MTKLLLNEKKGSCVMVVSMLLLVLCRFSHGQVLPFDLKEVRRARFAPLEGLAEGSASAQEEQRLLAERSRPLEVETRNTGIRLRLVPSYLCTIPRWSGDTGVLEPLMIREDLYVGKYEVTQKEWKSIMGKNPAVFAMYGQDMPVENVNWYEAQSFGKKLCELEGVETGTYRLLKTNEWEFACRAGTLGELYVFLPRWKLDYNWGLNKIAWNDHNTSTLNQDKRDWSVWDIDRRLHRGGWSGLEWNPDRPRPVGQKMPNAFGLYDMLGNVAEWLEDCRDPQQGLVTGGDWADSHDFLLTRRIPLNERSEHVGLRIVRIVHYGPTPSDFDVVGFRKSGNPDSVGHPAYVAPEPEDR